MFDIRIDGDTRALLMALLLQDGSESALDLAAMLADAVPGDVLNDLTS